ncbi:hypothetical protein PHYC_02793 [Phycisphaerales bacterium]|nr:hypothetical protein PHYC_02793 [Phycisphaerales bacterium]
MRVVLATIAGVMSFGAAAMAAPSDDPAPPPQSAESRPLGLPKPTPATSPSAPAASGSTGDWLRTVAALGGVLVLVVGAGVAVRGLAKRGGGLMGALGAGGRAPSGLLEVLGRYPVGRGSTLVLLKLDRRVLLVCQNASRVAGGSMSTLSEITDPEDVASILLKARDAEGESMSQKFQSLLTREDRAMDEPQRQPLAAAARPVSPTLKEPAGASNIRGRLQSLKGRRPLEVRA